MAAMRVAFFGTIGPMTFLPLEAVARGHEVVAVVRPWPRRSPLRRAAGAVARRVGLRERQPLEEWARERRVPCFTMGSGDDGEVVAGLRTIRPDVICISTFRWILSPRLIALPRHGALNLHASLLPRHRGALPLYWIYHRDDRETGVTVHRATERADAGEIFAQEAFALPRGFPVEELDRRNARAGARLLLEVVDAIAAGRTSPHPQDDSRATPAPAIRPGQRHVDFDRWEVERVWHFLAGLYPRLVEPLTDAGGRTVTYRGILGYEEGPEVSPPGSVTRAGAALHLHCRGGRVLLSSPER